MSLLSAIILSTFNYEYFFITKNPEFPTQAVDFPPARMSSWQLARLVQVKRRFPPPARMSPGKGTEPAGHTSCIAAENDSRPPMCCRLQLAARIVSIFSCSSDMLIHGTVYHGIIIVLINYKRRTVPLQRQFFHFCIMYSVYLFLPDIIRLSVKDALS